MLNRKAPEGQYVRRWDEIELLSGSLEAVAQLTRAEYEIFIVTNQRGIARGLVSRQDVEDIHHRVSEAVRQAGGRISAVYCCPHDYADACECRKPKPGMLHRAASEFGIDLRGSWMVGDSECDIEAGRVAGCRTALVSIHPNGFSADLVGPDLLSVAKQIIRFLAKS